MSNTFKKLQSKGSVRGFTLIELLVVIAIIGLLSTIIAAPIQSARKKARDAKKIAELKSTQLALEQYAESNGAAYPASISVLSPQFMPVLSGFSSSTASTGSTARDAFAYGTYEALASGGASSTFSYHLGVKLEVYGPALETDRDCIGSTLGAQLLVPACAVYNGDTMYSRLSANGSQLVTGVTNASTTWMTNSTTFPVPTGGGYGGADFQSRWYIPMSTGVTNNLSEQSSSTCVVANDCVFDVTSQQ